LYAVWNDFLIDKKTFNDEDIIYEFKNNWHESKKQFTESQLSDELTWIRLKDLIPIGNKEKTVFKK
jgi:hypothetical protein